MDHQHQRKFADIRCRTTWRAIVDAYVAATDETVGKLAVRLALNESTLRGQLRDLRSPTFDELVELHRRMPSALLHMLLSGLAGERFQVIAVEGQATRDPIVGAIDTNHQASRLIEMVHEAQRDGQIDHEERARIAGQAGEVQRLAAGVVSAASAGRT